MPLTSFPEILKPSSDPNRGSISEEVGKPWVTVGESPPNGGDQVKR